VSGAQIAADVAGAIRLVSLDVDGVLTDGTFVTAAGTAVPMTESRRFSVLDGLGIHLLQAAGLEVALVSGKKSAAVRARARDLGIREVHLGVTFEKVEAIDGILERNGWGWEQVAHLADDLADLAVLERVGLPAAVANAVPEVRSIAAWQGQVRGGEGAVREFAHALLDARGEWEEQVRAYVDRGRSP
jgi:3-deoxy-D-manno-octulosonate 8-phosphate phosphatase (KDO 8-P phosphatase)